MPMLMPNGSERDERRPKYEKLTGIEKDAPDHLSNHPENGASLPKRKMKKLHIKEVKEFIKVFRADRKR